MAKGSAKASKKKSSAKSAPAPVKAKLKLKASAKVTASAGKTAKQTKLAAPPKAAKLVTASKLAKAKAPAPKTAPAKIAKAKPAEIAPMTPTDVIAAGNSAPGFELEDDARRTVSSRELAGKPYVLYFYPKDDTPGCTTEACGFRDSLNRFTKSGVRVVGVSPDSPNSHAKFKQKYGLTFGLLSDPDKTLANAYGVWVKKQNYGREYMGIERSTFLVDGAGVVRKAWRRVRVDGHVDAVLAEAEKIREPRRS